MKRVFPHMYNKPNIGIIIILFVFTFMSFAYIPSALPLFTIDIKRDNSIEMWLEFAYHLLNFIVFGALLISSIKKDIQEIRLKNKKIGKTIAATIGLMAAVVLICGLLLWILPNNKIELFDVFPMAEFTVFYTAAEFIGINPVIGIVCMTVFAPAAIAGICCAACFAPAAVKRPWLGYAAVTAFLIVMLLFTIFYWKDYVGVSAGGIIICFLMRMPINLLACWSCQKTDGIIAPIVSLSALNLLTSLALVFIG